MFLWWWLPLLPCSLLLAHIPEEPVLLLPFKIFPKPVKSSSHLKFGPFFDSINLLINFLFIKCFPLSALSTLGWKCCNKRLFLGMAVGFTQVELYWFTAVLIWIKIWGYFDTTTELFFHFIFPVGGLWNPWSGHLAGSYSRELCHPLFIFPITVSCQSADCHRNFCHDHWLRGLHRCHQRKQVPPAECKY